MNHIIDVVMTFLFTNPNWVFVTFKFLVIAFLGYSFFELVHVALSVRK